MEAAGETSLGDRGDEEGIFLPCPASACSPVYIFLDVLSTELLSASVSILFPSEGENPAMTLVFDMLFDSDPAIAFLGELESSPTGDGISPITGISCWLFITIVSNTSGISIVREVGSC